MCFSVGYLSVGGHEDQRQAGVDNALSGQRVQEEVPIGALGFARVERELLANLCVVDRCVHATAKRAY